MDIDVKKLSKQQYISYFKIWFVILGIVVVVAAVLFVGSLLSPKSKSERDNTDSPSERVYDNANVLSDKEEDRLRDLIEETEDRIQCDIILVTINQPVELLSDTEIEKYGYRYNDWEMNMRDLADDFYDHNEFGYDEVGDDGDGVLLLDNWYPEQEGSWLSTSGEVFDKFGDYEIDRVLDAVWYGLDKGEYEAYAAYVKKVEQLMSGGSGDLVVYGNGGKYIFAVIAIPIIVALFFIFCNLKNKEGKVTTTASTYVANGKPRVNVSQDNYLRKHVTSRIIQTSSSSGGTRSGGGGGGHRSSSGRSHGGGGRRR